MFKQLFAAVLLVGSLFGQTVHTPTLERNNTWTGTQSYAPTSNGVDILSSTRQTDTLPTGNFINFKSLAGISLFKVDILGNATATSYLAGDGTAAAPAYSFASQPNTGWYKPAFNSIAFSSAGVTKWLLTGTEQRTGALGTYNFSLSNDPSLGIADTGLSRLAAGTVAVGNGTQGDASGTLTLATLSTSKSSTSPAFNISTRGDRQIILQNPDFEGSTVIPPPGWGATGSATLSYETISPAPGKFQSLKVVTTAQNFGAFNLNNYSVVPGDTYSISGVGKGDGNGAAQILISWYDKNHTFVSAAGVQTSSTSWTSLVISGTVPVNAVQAQIFLLNQGVTQPSTVWFDQISVQKTNFPGPVTTTGYQVNGAAPVNTFLKGNGTSYVSGSPVLASPDFANQGTTTTVLHGNAAGSPSFAGVSLTADAAANQGTVNQVLHGNAAGQPSFGGVSLTADTSANQGTTTTVLHGNAAGQPSFGAVSLTADVSGILPTANGGTGQNSTAAFPTSGVVVTEAAAEILTTKTISSSSNSLSIGTAAIPAAKGTANQALVMDGTGTNLTFGTLFGASISKADLLAQTASVGATTVQAAQGHMYRVDGYLVVTSVGGSGTTRFTITWTDSFGAQSIASATATNTVAGSAVEFNSVVFAANATNIQYSITVTGTVGSYDFHLRVTDLG